MRRREGEVRRRRRSHPRPRPLRVVLLVATVDVWVRALAESKPRSVARRERVRVDGAAKGGILEKFSQGFDGVRTPRRRAARRRASVHRLEHFAPVSLERREDALELPSKRGSVEAEVTLVPERRPAVDDASGHGEEAGSADALEAVRLDQRPTLRLRAGGFARAREAGGARDADAVRAREHGHQREELKIFQDVVFLVVRVRGGRVRETVFVRGTVFVRVPGLARAAARLGGGGGIRGRLGGEDASGGEAVHPDVSPERDARPHRVVRVGGEVDLATGGAHQEHRVLGPRTDGLLPFEELVATHAAEEVVERVDASEVVAAVHATHEEDRVQAEGSARCLDALQAHRRVRGGVPGDHPGDGHRAETRETRMDRRPPRRASPDLRVGQRRFSNSSDGTK